jgi:DNA invertase Pin-like site-specific DNA recombinase
LQPRPQVTASTFMATWYAAATELATPQEYQKHRIVGRSLGRVTAVHRNTLDVPLGLCYGGSVKCRLVAYRRVSTDKQGRSGLGLEAQEADIAAHVASSGCELIATYTEVESGRHADRPELARAISHAKRSKAILVIAKLDRLSRNVAFIANLMESGVEFVACDNPTAGKFTVHIFAALAEQEARRISENTKKALAKLKAKGVTLGTNNLTYTGTKLGGQRAAEVHRKAKLEAYSDVVPTIQELRHTGLSYAAIATRLNDDGQTTRRGKAWNASQVQRVLAIDGKMARDP